MARGKRSQFDTLVSDGDVFRLVAFIPIGSRLRPRTLSGETYWYARPPARAGVTSTEHYIGSDDNKRILERAWATVQAEIAKVESTEDGRKLRELEALSGGPSLARTSTDDLVEFPVYDKILARRGGDHRPKR